MEKFAIKLVFCIHAIHMIDILNLGFYTIIPNNIVDYMKATQVVFYGCISIK